MAYNILQLSDIHLGSDYEGNLDTEKQWKAVLKDAKINDGYDAVIITGDLMDDAVCVDPASNAKSGNGLTEDGKLGKYMEILNDAKSLCSHGGKLLVTPGNHDNRKLLAKAAVSMGLDNAREDMFDNPGENIQFAHVGSRTIVLIDSGNGEPYKAIAELAYMANRNEDWKRDLTMIFTHKPFQSPNLYHRFMKDKMLPTDICHHVIQYASEYFCGHLHHYASVHARLADNEFCMTVAPGIQCQIDPYSAKCNAVPLPGYLTVEFGYYGSGIEKRIHIVENWQELAE